METKALTKREKLELEKFDYGDDFEQGFQDQSSDELLIPWVNILQDLSPEITGADGKAIDGAKAGEIINSVSKDRTNKLLFVPAFRVKSFIEWIPRTSGGGFVGVHDPESDLILRLRTATKFGLLKNPETNNDIVETITVYGFICEEAEPVEPAAISFTSSKLKVYRAWRTALNKITVLAGDTKRRPPLYAHPVNLTTVRETGKKGTYYNFVVTPTGGDSTMKVHDRILASMLAPTDARFLAAKELSRMVEAGTAKADVTKQDEGGASEGDGGGAF